MKMKESGNHHFPIRQSQSPGMGFCDIKQENVATGGTPDGRTARTRRRFSDDGSKIDRFSLRRIFRHMPSLPVGHVVRGNSKPVYLKVTRKMSIRVGGLAKSDKIM
ncbi:MAG: hypothetical protein LGR52_04355 [Candidatus Thiosymbion ectosymbiont of Robbea hypermnestra]|nr:hypothetical protein [Candidatus Thiosymbion ectosymbiont of Robbea hypermnestra]